MTDIDFFRLANAATAGRKDLELAQALDFETGESHHCHVVANLAASATAKGGKLYMPVRLNVGNRDERPSKTQDPPGVHLYVKADLTADPVVVDYGPNGLRTFADPEAGVITTPSQKWWLGTDTNTAPTAHQVLFAQGTGADEYKITYNLPALTANPAADQTYPLILLCEQPNGTIQDRATEQITIHRYAPRALYSASDHFGSLISVIGATASGNTHDFTLASNYTNHDNRPVTAYFPNRPQAQRLRWRGQHWTFELINGPVLSSKGNAPGSGWLLRVTRDDNPTGPHYTYPQGVLVPVHVETTDHGDKSVITLHYLVQFL